MLLSIFQILGLSVYTIVLMIFITMLCPPVRRKLKEISLYGDCFKKRIAESYEKYLYILVIIRQVLLFSALIVIVSIMDFSITLEYFPSLILLGLSIIVFVSVQLPLLMKAHILVNFKIDDEVYDSTISFKPREDPTLVEARIYNLGFSTYKNSVAIFYFGEEFEILPCNDPKYEHLKFHFKKEFSIQEIHGGALFSPKDNFLSIPPQEVFIFPMYIKIPEKEKKGIMHIDFYSENTWGMTVIYKQVIVER